jgi:3-deoxy-D-manno-octulosonic-acid transferase
MPTEDIYLWDTLGEMGTLFRAVKVIAMGGSFAPIGGHNPIEPAQYGCTVICGPHMWNFTAIMEAFDAQNAVLHAADANALATHLEALWKDATLCAAYGERARKVCEMQAASLPRLMAALAPWQKDVNNHA